MGEHLLHSVMHARRGLSSIYAGEPFSADILTHASRLFGCPAGISRPFALSQKFVADKADIMRGTN